MEHVLSNGIVLDVEIIRKQNKNIYFRIKDDLKLYITAPMYISWKELEKILNEKDSELIKMYEKMESKVKDNEMFWFLGKKYYIVFDDNVVDVTFDDNKVITFSQEALDSFLNREMLRIYNEEIQMIKKCFATLPDFTLRTRKMSTRWGVCDTRKKIVTLNTELIKKEIDLIDYVIVHELCHFFEANHSKNFWALVAQAFPNYKEARKRLRG